MIKNKGAQLILASLLVLILALVMVPSCKSETPPTTTPTTQPTTQTTVPTTAADTPKYGGTYTAWMSGSGANPANPSQAAAQFIFFYADPIQERPVIGDFEKYGPRGNAEYSFNAAGYVPPQYLKGNLVDTWEITTQQITYHVRPGIMWQARKGVMDARELTGADFAADINAFWKAPWGRKFDPFIESVTAPDKYTVVLKFKLFSSSVFYWLGTEDRACVSPPELIAAGDDKWENQCGTGAWMFESYTVGSSMSYTRNPNYWKKATIKGKEYALPFADRLVYVIMPDVSTQIAALRTGAIDLHDQVPVSQWKSLNQTNPELKFKKFSESGAAVNLNCKRPPFDNLKVRQAMMIGTDMTAFQKLMLAEDLPMNWFPWFIGNTQIYVPLAQLPDDIKKLYTYNPTLAKQMLAEAGFPNGFSTKYFCQTSSDDVDRGALLKDQWSKIGVTLEVVPTDSTTMNKINIDWSYEGTSQHGVPGMQVPNPVDTLIRVGMKTGQNNMAGFSDPAYDDIATRLGQTQDGTSQQLALIKEAGLYLLRQAPYVPLSPVPRAIYWQPWIKNYYGELSVSDQEVTDLITFSWIDKSK